MPSISYQRQVGRLLLSRNAAAFTLSPMQNGSPDGARPCHRRSRSQSAQLWLPSCLCHWASLGEEPGRARAKAAWSWSGSKASCQVFLTVLSFLVFFASDDLGSAR